MANELQLSYESGNNLYAIVRRISDAYVAQSTTQTFVPWVDGNIVNYDVAYTDHSGDYYSADFPSWITAQGDYLVNNFVRAGATPATTDEVLPSSVFYWSGGAEAGAAVGGNTVTIGSCVTLLRTIARNAGISDSDDSTYDLTNKHLIVQLIGDDFARRTRCIQKVSGFVISDADENTTLATVTGFHTERIQRAWIDAQDSPIKVIGIDDMIGLRSRSTRSGKPTRMAFSATTGVAVMYPTPDDDYTGKIQWWAPLTGWTAGDSLVANTTLNIPADLMRGAIMAGGIYFLQKDQPQNAKIVDQSRQDYEAFVTRNMGTGSLGVTSVEREYECFDVWQRYR